MHNGSYDKSRRILDRISRKIYMTIQTRSDGGAAGPAERRAILAAGYLYVQED